jgi:hypothetical protein
MAQELARLADKEVLAERFEIEKRNLERTLQALRDAARHDVQAVKARVQNAVDKVRPKNVVFERRVAFLAAAFVSGVLLGFRKRHHRRSKR